jgi:hypothetical protein
VTAHAHPTAARAADRQAAAEAPRPGGMRRVFRALLPYLWPAGRADLKARVLAALLLLVLAKVVLVTVPFFYKAAVDALEGRTQAVAVPVALIVAYGVARVLSQGFGELRDAIFARVSQHATRACTGCRSASTSGGAPAASRGRSSAAPRASSSCSGSRCSTWSRRCSRSCS